MERALPLRMIVFVVKDFGAFFVNPVFLLAVALE